MQCRKCGMDIGNRAYNNPPLLYVTSIRSRTLQPVSRLLRRRMRKRILYFRKENALQHFETPPLPLLTTTFIVHIYGVVAVAAIRAAKKNIYV